ncbi:HtaA domain-containing protein [Mycobacterium sp. 48b]|uniref:HtaA domain-containing protein n=1 Tax=Mycobacterium sp. 48b TaxID=3400426 RepID=UPI003AAB1FCD
MMRPVESVSPTHEAHPLIAASGSGHVVPGLYWGIKRSFVSYVARMPDGRATAGLGAQPLPNGDFLFLPDTTHDSDEFRFRGDVRFSGHMGMLWVRIADPWIDVETNQGELSIASPADSESRLRLASVTFDDHIDDRGHVVLHASVVRLLGESLSIFNDVYEEGQLLEPLTVVLRHG